MLATLVDAFVVVLVGGLFAVPEKGHAAGPGRGHRFIVRDDSCHPRRLTPGTGAVKAAEMAGESELAWGMKATWQGTVIAESPDTVVVEGNHYFPADSLKMEYFQPSGTHTTCPWKGTASYYTLRVQGQENRDAAWYYPEPKEAAAQIRGRVAFWKGVEVSE